MLGGELLFTACAPDTGCELWRTDGTAEGTTLVANIAPGPAPSYARPLDVLEDVLIVAAETPATGEELWRIDRATSRAELLRDIRPGPETSNIGPVDRAERLAARQRGRCGEAHRRTRVGVFLIAPQPSPPATERLDHERDLGGGTESAGGSSTAPHLPERIGDFRIVRRLGAGGMGIVYLHVVVGDGH